MSDPNPSTASDGPLDRREVEAGYRRLRLAMVSAMLWSFVVAALVVYFGGGKPYAYVVAGLIVVLEVVSTPLWIRYFRRRRDEQIREYEAGLGKLTADA